MAQSRPGADPLGYGNPEEDMDDLTAQLENALQNYKAGNEADDDYDLGDGSALPPGHAHGLERYQMLDDEAHEGRSSGGAGAVSTTAPLEHPSLTYGQLVTPSTHEGLHYPGQGTSAQQATYAQGAGTAGGPYGGPANGSAAGTPDQGGAAAGSTAAGRTQAPGAGAAAAAGPSMMSPAAANRFNAAPMVFTVTDPVKKEMPGFMGLKAGHVTYLITTKLRGNVPGFTRRGTWAVRRRFREFVALADVLKARYRGYFLPPRPEKNAVEGQRMTDTFVAERRVALERYLNRLAQHPVVGLSEELRLFVELEGELESSPVWLSALPAPKAGLVEGTAKLSKQLLGLEQSVLDPVQAVQPTKKTADPLRAIRETAQAMTAGSAGSTTPIPAGEAELRHEREVMEGKRDALVVTTREAERVVHRMDRISTVCGDLGLAFFKLSKLEESEGPHLAQFTGTVRQSQTVSSVTKLLATSLVRAARLSRRAVSKSAYELSALHEHLASMPPAIKGLTTREKQLLTSDTLQADIATRQKQIRELEAAGEKVLGGDPAKAKKVEDLRADIAKLQCAIDAANAEYGRISQVNRQELVRVHHEFQTDMVQMVEGLAAAQAVSAARIAEVWLQLASELVANPSQVADVRSQLVEAQQAYRAVLGTRSRFNPQPTPGSAAAAAGGGGLQYTAAPHAGVEGLSEPTSSPGGQRMSDGGAWALSQAGRASSGGSGMPSPLGNPFLSSDNNNSLI